MTGMDRDMIHSLQNTLLKRVLKYLRLAKYRKKDGLFVIEGPCLLEEIFRHPERFTCDTVLYREGYDFVSDDLSSKNAGQVREVVTWVWEKAFPEHKSSMSVVALCRRQHDDDVPPVLPRARPVLLLDRIQDPGNLGSLLRSAVGSGFSHIFLSTGSVDAWSPKVLRAGMGAHFRLHIFEFLELTDFIVSNRQNLALVAEPGSLDFFNLTLQTDACFFLGNEGEGLARSIVDHPYVQAVYIPMCAGMESLNVAMAATICCFEWHRQCRSTKL